MSDEQGKNNKKEDKKFSVTYPYCLGFSKINLG
ncbi:protein of unknown function [[Clostridium] ultunense Esp]|uniref:Uncharacterized protein n=1 Tax=[Clostridium] ultunense Esp TaxID=1288971 RepID=A0A1M4PSY5_9FIRM|nr:protein of unknown function [[Clostridium] ultunense Esp]